MERYFFDLDECGLVTPDQEGQELVDLTAAERFAIKAARALMCAELTDGALCLSCYIDIRDAGGQPLMRVRFADAVSISGGSRAH